MGAMKELAIVIEEVMASPSGSVLSDTRKLQLVEESCGVYCRGALVGRDRNGQHYVTEAGAEVLEWYYGWPCRSDEVSEPRATVS